MTTIEELRVFADHQIHINTPAHAENVIQLQQEILEFVRPHGDTGRLALLFAVFQVLPRS